MHVTEKEPFTHEYKRQFAFVHQDCDAMLARQLTVEQNLQCANMPKYPHFSRLPKYHDNAGFIRALGIDIAKPVHLLSGGQRQIVAIMMALQKNARIILLDEPTAALDEKNADMVMQFLATLTKTTEITGLIICHDKELVLRYAHDGYYNISSHEKGQTRTLEKIML
jgi:ABC-type lipoprotein export system ATPase subunit